MTEGKSVIGQMVRVSQGKLRHFVLFGAKVKGGT